MIMMFKTQHNVGHRCSVCITPVSLDYTFKKLLKNNSNNEAEENALVVLYDIKTWTI